MYSNTGAWKCLQVVHDEILVRRDLLPLEVIDVHFLARVVVYTAEYVNVVAVVIRIVKESSIWHLTQLNELHRFEVEHHGVFRSSAVIMSSENNDFIRGDQSHCLSFYWQWELDRQDAPLIICHIILLYRINSSAAFIATKDKNVRIFKNYCWTSASLLIQISDPLPTVHVDRISFTAL